MTGRLPAASPAPPPNVVLGLTADRPGRLLTLASASRASTWAYRIIATTLLLPVQLVTLLGRAHFAARGHYRTGPIWRLLGLRWDREAGVAVATLACWPLLGAHRITIPFGRLRGIKLHVGPEGGAEIPLHLAVRFERPGRGEARLECSFRVAALDRHDEAQDLAFRIARVISWQWYELREGPDGIDVELVAERGQATSPFRGTAEEWRLEPVPHLGLAADYRKRSAEARSRESSATTEPVSDRDKPADDGKRPAEARFEEPATPVAPFHPSRLLTEDRVLCWEPGRRVEFRRGSWTKVVVRFLLMFVFGGVPLGAGVGAICFLVLGTPLFLILQLDEGWVETGAALVMSICIALVGVRLSVSVVKQEPWCIPGRTVLDWDRGTAMFLSFRGPRRLRLERIQGVSYSRLTTSHGAVKQYYEVLLLLPGRNEVLLTSFGGSGEVVSLMVDLARGLDVPWRGYIGGDGLRE